MNKKTLVTIIFFLQIMICWNLNAAPVRQQINLNRGWLFTLGDVEGAEQTSFSDQSWEQVNLPHSFSLPYFMWKSVYLSLIHI